MEIRDFELAMASVMYEKEYADMLDKWQWEGQEVVWAWQMHVGSDDHSMVWYMLSESNGRITLCGLLIPLGLHCVLSEKGHYANVMAGIKALEVFTGKTIR